MFLCLLVMSYFANGSKLHSSPECTISINKDLGEPQPLLIKEDRFASPKQGSDNIRLNKDEIIKVYCPGSTVLIHNNSAKTNLTKAKCNNGKFIIPHEKKVPFKAITCSKQPKRFGHFTGNTCLGKYKEFEIGYKYKSKILRLILGCFDDINQITIYTVSKIPKTIGSVQVAYPRTNWKQGRFYNLTNIDKLYSKNNQEAVLNTLLGSNAAKKYVTKSNYLSRGHLSPKADFLFGSQQRVTFYLVNAVPQWQTMNRGNWFTLESNSRKLAISRNLDLEVYTGTFDVASLPHETTGKDIKLYLYVDGKRKKIPVPKYFWKVLYHAKSKAGVAFVVLNNPYFLDDAKDTICEDICNKLNYLSWVPGHLSKGYAYCCDVNDLRRTITVIPEFEVDTLLV